MINFWEYFFIALLNQPSGSNKISLETLIKKAFQVLFNVDHIAKISKKEKNIVDELLAKGFRCQFEEFIFKNVISSEAYGGCLHELRLLAVCPEFERNRYLLAEIPQDKLLKWCDTEERVLKIRTIIPLTEDEENTKEHLTLRDIIDPKGPQARCSKLLMNLINIFSTWNNLEKFLNSIFFLIKNRIESADGKGGMKLAYYQQAKFILRELSAHEKIKKWADEKIKEIEGSENSEFGSKSTLGLSDRDIDPKLKKELRGREAETPFNPDKFPKKDKRKVSQDDQDNSGSKKQRGLSSSSNSSSGSSSSLSSSILVQATIGREHKIRFEKHEINKIIENFCWLDHEPEKELLVNKILQLSNESVYTFSNNMQQIANKIVNAAFEVAKQDDDFNKLINEKGDSNVRKIKSAIEEEMINALVLKIQLAASAGPSVLGSSPPSSAPPSTGVSVITQRSVNLSQQQPKKEAEAEWYSEEQIGKLVRFQKKQKPFLIYVFDTYGDDFGNIFQRKKSFVKQFLALINLKNTLLEYPAYFIAMQPGETLSYHFILGIIVNKKLLIINPMGLTKREYFYHLLKVIKERGMVEDIYISTTEIQRDPNSIISCGPICIELFNCFALLEKQQILEIMSTKVKHRNKHTLNFNMIDISEFLSDNLRSLLKCNREEYLSCLEVIRKDHQEILSQPELHSMLQGFYGEQHLVMEIMDGRQIDQASEMVSLRSELQRLSQQQSEELREEKEQQESVAVGAAAKPDVGSSEIEELAGAILTDVSSSLAAASAPVVASSEITEENWGEQSAGSAGEGFEEPKQPDSRGKIPDPVVASARSKVAGPGDEVVPTRDPGLVTLGKLNSPKLGMETRVAEPLQMPIAPQLNLQQPQAVGGRLPAAPAPVVLATPTLRLNQFRQQQGGAARKGGRSGRGASSQQSSISSSSLTPPLSAAAGKWLPPAAPGLLASAPVSPVAQPRSQQRQQQQKRKLGDGGSPLVGREEGLIATPASQASFLPSGGPKGKSKERVESLYRAPLEGNLSKGDDRRAYKPDKRPKSGSG